MRKRIHFQGPSYTRRELLRRGLFGLGVSAGLPFFLEETSRALAAEALLGSEGGDPNRILVVVELSGGNDGLNTVVPYGDDAYYRLRPNLAIPAAKVRRIDPGIGFHPSLVGFEELYKDGKMALVQGCGYENPSLSHFAAMGFWHTGVPNGGAKLGWVGRFADHYRPEPRQNLLINIARSQSLAMRSEVHTPLVFDDPTRFKRDGAEDQQAVFAELSRGGKTANPTLDFLRQVATNAAESSAFVRQAVSAYRTPVDYGVLAGLGGDLRKVAALIHSGMPTRVYYVSYRGNAFDTHVHQADLHDRLLMYTSDAIRGFMQDLDRIGRSDDVALMMFTEFGRRVEENASLGTDHGTATPMFLFGSKLEGGIYGEHPSLTDLDDGNLKMTTDFRRVYATVIREWMGYKDTRTLLKGEFPTLGVFPGESAPGKA